MSKCDEYLRVNKKDVCLTHTNKLLFPKIHKREVIEYYHKVAPRMLPYMKDRPLVMQRYTEGINKPGFFMKKTQGHYPSWVKSLKFKLREGKMQSQVLCNDAATLVYLANQDAISYHVWSSRADKLEYPDRVMFDLDCDNYPLVKKAALIVKKELMNIGLRPYVMLTGSKGLHITVPLKRDATYEEVRKFARNFAGFLVHEYPKIFTVEVRKAKRRGRVFVDYVRNAYGQTTVVPYSIRPYPGAPVAMPVRWEELPKTKSAKDFNIHNSLKRKDAWKGMKASSMRRALDRL